MPTELSILIEAAMIGGGMGIVGVTSIITVASPVNPVVVSVTMSVTVYVPGVVYMWVISVISVVTLPSS